MDATKNFWKQGKSKTFKIIFSIALAIMASALISLPKSENLVKMMICYCIYGVSLLIFYWISFYKTSVEHMQSEAQKDDNSNTYVFFLILTSILGSLLAIGIIILSKNSNPQTKMLHILSSLATLTISWFLLHTIYTVKYVHLYYGNSQFEKGHGLDFPEKGNFLPNFWDFAYFSFVLGMTFQVSDISISDRKIRHVALWHSLISFIFNMIIIAVSINLIAGLT